MVSSLGDRESSRAATSVTIKRALQNVKQYFKLSNINFMKQKRPLMRVVEKVGSKAELARILGCSLPYVSLWANGHRKIPIKYVKKLVELSGGELKKRDLRPDIYED